MRLIPILLLLMLAGCKSTVDYTLLAESRATLSNIELSEQVNNRKGRYKLVASFHYEVDNFNQVDALYDCSVQFVTTRGGYMTLYESLKSVQCDVDESSGRATLVWTTPLDKDWARERQGFTRLLKPHVFFVAMYQRTGEETSKLIGRTRCHALGPSNPVVETDSLPICINEQMGVGTEAMTHSKRQWR